MISCAGLGSPSSTGTQTASTFQLTVTAPANGAGTITSSPAGINCPTTCTASFAQGTKVTLTETPGTNYFFGGWGGSCSGMSACSLTITAATSVSATFNTGVGLTVALAGTGTGTVTSTPVGINCSSATPTTCTASFAPNSPVTLSETPETGGTFAGWSGACTGTVSCSVTVTTGTSVTATFNPPSEALTVSIVGNGTITSSPTGISCSNASTTGCTANLPQGAQISLMETPGTNYNFSAWGGACLGTTACSFSLSAATNVTATFTAATGSIQSINHIIFFAQENRSFDHYFGYMRQYWANNGIPDQPFDGLPQFTPAADCTVTNGVSSCAVPQLPGCDPAFPYIPPSGTMPAQNTTCIVDSNSPLVPSFHMQSVCTEELSPFWNEAHRDWNIDFDYPNTINWLGNGFVKAGADDARQYPLQSNNNMPENDPNGYRTMGYFTDADLNYYYYMASKFATSDRWFAPLLSRTQLNRAYILAATSDGYAYPPGSNSLDDAPLPSPTIFQALTTAGITWRVYVDPNSSDPFPPYTNCATATGATQNQCLANVSYVNMFTYESQVQANPALYQNFVPTTQFATDLQNDSTFPQVVFIEPPSDAGLDEHPSDIDQYPENIQKGATFASGLINSFMASNSWPDSAMIFTYDEPGGFYDHVQPQPVPVPTTTDTYPIDLQPTDACDGADQSTGVCSFGTTGYRVPVIVISPFAKQNFVSHVVRDTTVWLNFVEERFNVPALTARDAYWSTAQAGTTPPATMDEFFDFANPPWVTPPTPPTQSLTGTCSTAAPTP
ncbi:MAG: alkaline phosphatase family protein [Candidatus Sulfotelmatobacter sp.]